MVRICKNLPLPRFNMATDLHPTQKQFVPTVIRKAILGMFDTNSMASHKALSSKIRNSTKLPTWFPWIARTTVLALTRKKVNAALDSLQNNTISFLLSYLLLIAKRLK
jgi:hypothetical protein